MQAQLALPFDKRWQDRREIWRHPGETIRPSEFGVDVAPERSARALILQHHYSGSFPAARLSVGLYRRTGLDASRLVGVAVFSVPMQARAIEVNAGVPASEGVELGRFVCLPEVAFNGETWFLRRAFALLRQEKPEVRAVLSYADPVERRTAEGRLTKPAHAGQIYQAHNAAFLGRATPRWHWVSRDGQIISPRALSKIRLEERGQDYAARQLVAAGADARRPGEASAAWLQRVLREPTFRRLKHPGNFTYVFGLDAQARKLAAIGAQPYPKLEKRL